MLLVEIHKPESFNLSFLRSFLQIMVEIGEKYALKSLFDVLEAKLASKNRKLVKCGSRPPYCAIP